jgi:eukaryotic-like serine/threonine-protein kinase
VAGRYVLLDQIGAGGMGSVWRARDLRTGGLVAVKVLGHHSGALLARFVREQSIRLRHPHVVAPTGWAAEDDVVLLTMDLVCGGSVQGLLAEHGPLPEGCVATILGQTLRALAAVHASGMVHRDVKPANLLLEATADGSLHVRLADFGVAVTLAGERLTAGPAVIGTEGYMSPDQARGAAPEPRQDLYAVGVLGVHLLTGRRPQAGVTLPSGRLRPLLERLLADEPSSRPANAEQALALLARLDVPAAPGVWVRDRLGPAPDERPRGAVPWSSVPWSSVPWGAVATIAASASVTVGCLMAISRMLG